MTIDLSRARIKPFAHQVLGVEKLVQNRIFALFDEMGVGKTKQVIDAAQVLYVQGTIERVIVIAPAAVRSVWYDPDLGELAKHLWTGLPATVTEFHARLRSWKQGESSRPLQWVITNYDFIRNLDRRKKLIDVCDAKTMLVLDESAAVKNYRAEQTKACADLRAKCGRIVLLNGTPIANSPADMYSQGRMLHPDILKCKTFFHFRSRYAIMGGWQQKQIVGWQNIPDMQARFAPYVLRRLKEQCLDLPPKLPPVTLTATLTPETWQPYKEMRDDMVAWLSETTVSTAAQAVVKALRLAQITSGFLGGIEAADLAEYSEQNDDAWLINAVPVQGSATRELGREKLDVFLGFLDEQLTADPHLKMLVWCRFRPELARLVNELRAKYEKLYVGEIRGGQKPAERTEAIRLLDPRTMPDGPVVVAGTPGSGSVGLNLAGARIAVYLSNDYSLKTRLQSEDRIHRPGQVNAVSYYDIIAVGPQQQKTIDHAVLKALLKKESIAQLTTAAWISVLTEE